VRLLVPVAILVLSLLAVPTGAGDSLGQPDPQGGQSVEYFEVRYGVFGFARLRILRFDPASIELRLLAPGNGKSLAPIVQMPGCKEALACVNGPFFDVDDSPIGLLVSQEREEQPLRNVSWGVFWIDRLGKPHVDRKGDFQSKVDVGRQVSFGVQSGPTLMRKGRLLKRKKREVARRTAIGIDVNGRVVIIVAGFPLSLNGLAEVAGDKLALEYLVNLDGGSSTQMLTAPDLGGDHVSGLPVARAIGLFQITTPGISSRPTSRQ